MKTLKHSLLLSLAVATSVVSPTTSLVPATAHMAPINDVGGPVRRDRWRHDWNRRWDDNWGNSWASYDNDYYYNNYNRRRAVNRYNTVNNSTYTNDQSDDNQNQETWSSLAKPGQEIPNFHEVHPWLFRGGQPRRDGMRELYDMGVRTVIDLRCDPNQIASEQQICEEHGMRFVSMPMVTSRKPTQQQINNFLSVVDNAHKTSDGGAVFVHCHHGSDRTGTMIAIYRMLRDHYSYSQAYNEMLRYGFNQDLTTLATAVKSESSSSHPPTRK